MLYLDLLKNCLTRAIFPEPYKVVHPIRSGVIRFFHIGFLYLVHALRKELVFRVPFDPEARAAGKDWPAEAETMVGLRRLDHLQFCVEDVLQRGVPGDLLEAGVWRGGAAILMRAVLKAHGDCHRTVWVADSFQGLPKPDRDRAPADAGDAHWKWSELAVSEEQVRRNFARYGLLDDQVRFLPGWFRETLANSPLEHLAVLRVDADMYESVTDVLEGLYDRVSPGGYVIIDDYEAVAGCKLAVTDFRTRRGITEPLQPIDWCSAFWRRDG